MPRVAGEMRHALNRRGAGADHGNALVAQLVQISGGIAAGVLVIPSAGVKRVALESIDSGDAGKFGAVERPAGHDHEAGAQAIVTIGRDNPSAFLVAPDHVPDLGLKQGSAVEIELLSDAPGVRQDFRRERIFLFGDVTGLFEQRQIDVRLDIALRARVAVPVPGPAEISALLDDANVLDSGLTQPRAREQAAEAAADDQHFDRIVERRPRKSGLNVGIVYIAAEVALDFDVLIGAVGADAFVALLAIPGAQSIGIEVETVNSVVGGNAD